MIEQLGIDIDRARNRIETLVSVWRFTWCVNVIVVFVGFYYQRYDIAALAGSTCVLSLIAAAISRRIGKLLGMENQHQYATIEIEIYDGKLAA